MGSRLNFATRLYAGLDRSKNGGLTDQRNRSEANSRAPIMHPNLKTFARRRLVLRYYLLDWTYKQIAEALDVDLSTITSDIKFIRKKMTQVSHRDSEKMRSREFAMLSMVQQEALEAWDRSIGRTQEKTVENEYKPIPATMIDDDGQTRATGETVTVRVSRLSRVKTVDKVGDVGFLRLVKECCMEKLKIAGVLDDRDNTNVNVAVAPINWDQLARVTPIADPVKPMLESLEPLPQLTNEGTTSVSTS